MFEMFNPSQSELISQIAHPTAGQALKLYRSALRNSKLASLWAKINQRSNSLLDLNELEPSLNVRGRHYAGLRAVAIDQIRGSEGRVQDFDSAFHPLSEKTRDRWLSVATARMQGAGLPAVELIQVGDFFFVRDGHHRISVARALGEEAIDAEINVWDVKGSLPWEKTPSTKSFAAQPV
jgi:hypothetical protein